MAVVRRWLPTGMPYMVTTIHTCRYNCIVFIYSFLTLLHYSIEPHYIGVHHLRHDGHLSHKFRLLFGQGALFRCLDSYLDGRYSMLEHRSIHLTKLTCGEGGGRDRGAGREREEENGKRGTGREREMEREM